MILIRGLLPSVLIRLLDGLSVCIDGFEADRTLYSTVLSHQAVWRRYPILVLKSILQDPDSLGSPWDTLEPCPFDF